MGGGGVGEIVWGTISAGFSIKNLGIILELLAQHDSPENPGFYPSFKPYCRNMQQETPSPTLRTRPPTPRHRGHKATRTTQLAS